MEIIPGQGVGLAQIGELRADVERRIGLPTAENGSRCHYDNIDPPMVIDYSGAGAVELLEVAYSGEQGHEVNLDGIQLTYRLIDDVLRDLAALGHEGRPSDVGSDFPSGFAIWSMGSLSLTEVDPTASRDDHRLVVEGVSVAASSYFGF